MKGNQTNWLVRASVFAALFIVIGGLVLREAAQWRLISAQNQEERITKTMPAREAAGLNLLSSLLSSDGVSVQATALLPSRAEESRTVLVHLKSVEKALPENDFLTVMPKDNLFSLLETKVGKGVLARQRSLELSPSQILVVAVNQNKQALWWSLSPDPRIFYAEVADKAGSLSGQALYRTTAEMLVAYPADKTITELRFYHPDWDGQTYKLQSLGNLSLSATEN